MTTETAAEPASSDGRSAVAIVTGLWEKMESLVQLEIKLGLAESVDKITALKRELFAKAIGGALVFAGGLTVIAALVALLSLKMALWLAASLTGFVVIAAGAFVLRRALTDVSATESERTLTPLTAASNQKDTRHGIL